MLWGAVPQDESDQVIHRTIVDRGVLVFQAFLVGCVTGFVGVGGGFVIVPALVFFAKLPMKKAVGTSLLIISGGALVGFMGDVFRGMPFDAPFLLGLLGLTGVGSWMGTRLNAHVPVLALKRVFGYFVLVMGLGILSKELFF